MTVYLTSRIIATEFVFKFGPPMLGSCMDITGGFPDAFRTHLQKNKHVKKHTNDNYMR